MVIRRVIIISKSVYYAHHMWKYNTNVETLEIAAITKEFPEYKIINPNGAIVENGSEKDAMNQCFNLIRNECDILIFSTLLEGEMGKGVYSEIKLALDLKKDVYFLDRDYNFKRFTLEDYYRLEVIYFDTDSYRLYAKINY